MTFKLKKIKLQSVTKIGLPILTGILFAGIILYTVHLLSTYKSLKKEFIYIDKLISDSYVQYAGFRLGIDQDDDFFNEGQNSYTTAFTRSINQLNDTLSGIYSLRFLKRKIDRNKLQDTLGNAIHNYESSFNNLILAIKEKGIRDLGNIYETRNISDELITVLKPFADSTLYSSAIKIKDLEAAFLYCGKPSAYYSIQDHLDVISNSPLLFAKDLSVNDNITSLIDTYKGKLDFLNDLFDRIGTNENQFGIISDFEKSYSDLNLAYNYLAGSLSGTITTIRKTIIIIGLVAAILLILAYFYLIFHFQRLLRAPINIIRDYSYNLSKGKLLKDSLPRNDFNPAFSAIAENLNGLNASLVEKKKFVDDLLKQKFKADISLQGKSDTFGKTLLALKENMRKTRDEQLHFNEENEHRRYINEGIAKFADIMRTTSHDLNELADAFIKEIVRYLKAIQGGLFLVEEGKENELNLAAAFAYNRKKYIQKTIGLGEGLVGTCAMEKQSINLTEIPEEYIEITSGLGDAPPTNILLLPVIHEETLIGVVEIASLKKFEDEQIELGENIAGSLASTIIAARVNTRTSALLAKSQRQAAEMSEQEEEMRQNMEELKATQEESQRREEELEGILNAIDQSFYVLEYDTDGTIIKVNQKLIYLMNTSSDTIIGKNHQQIFGRGTKADAAFFARLSEGSTVELTENVSINNKPTTLINTFSPIRSKTGETLRVLNIMSITY